MRKTLDTFLTNLARKDDTVYVLIGDLGNFPEFQKEFPDRLINTGIAESNMVSLAAGLALTGNKVFIYSVAGFCIHRGFEQLKFEVGHISKNLVIINAGASLCYNRVGSGHYLTDDFALMRTLPNVNIYAPIDKPEFEKTLVKAYLNKEITYIRTGMDNCPDVEVRESYTQYSPSNKVTVITTGVFSSRMANLCKDLPVDLMHVLNLKDIKEEKLKEKIIVIEDHIKFGGLTACLSKKPNRHLCFPDSPTRTAKSQEKLLSYYGLDEANLKKEILELL